jgi:hypothetical protein
VGRKRNTGSAVGAGHHRGVGAEGSEHPAHREADVVIRDGSTVHLRPVRREDEPALRELFEELSPGARMLRFFSGASDLEAAAGRMARRRPSA